MRDGVLKKKEGGDDFSMTHNAVREIECVSRRQCSKQLTEAGLVGVNRCRDWGHHPVVLAITVEAPPGANRSRTWGHRPVVLAITV